MKVKVSEYVKIGERFVPWYQFRIINLDTQKEVQGVIWCDDSLGKLEKFVFDKDGDPYIENGELKKEILIGNFKIEEIK